MVENTRSRRKKAMTVLWKRSTLPVVVGARGAVRRWRIPFSGADMVEEDLAPGGAEPPREHIAVVGQDLLRHPVAAHGLGQGFAHRTSGRAEEQSCRDAEAGVVVDAGAVDSAFRLLPRD